jgi:hypothetical protein
MISENGSGVMGDAATEHSSNDPRGSIHQEPTGIPVNSLSVLTREDLHQMRLVAMRLLVVAEQLQLDLDEPQVTAR